MSTTDLPGSSLLAGRYRLVERLGAGGMSVVWRGFDEVLGRQVAVKVLPPSTSADPSFRRRLRAEAQAAARLSHPHITNVYDYGEATTVDGEPVPYVVMELVDGESLAAVLARVRRLPWPAVVRITSEVAAALAAAHSRGIVHRDVTPANVMLTSTGAKVVDFGISALIGENDIDPDGSLLGTPAYLAPERLEGGQVSPATDVYAVGLLIYRTLIGQLPWDVGTTTALLRAHQYTEPEPLPYVDGLPREVAALVARCLEKRPADRPSSAELAQLLASIAAGNPVGAPGYKPDWADSGEDTTILPNRQAFTSDGLGRVRPGHASVADAIPVQAGRGVAAVPAAAMGAAAVAASASLPPVPPVPPGPAGRVSFDAPVSPAPGHAVPVRVSDVEDAVAGRPVTDPRGPAPETPARRGPNPPAPRNSRFNGSARPAAAGGAAFPSGPVRPAFNSPDDLTVVGEGANANTRFSRRKPRTAGARRLMVLAGTVLALAAVTYSWTLMSNHDHSKAAALPSVIPASGKCVVSYTVLNQVGNTFTASLVVANRDTVPVSNWNLWWVMPGDQVLAGNGQEKLFQQDRGVTVTAADTLGPQQTKSMTITGKFNASNAAPMVFQLDNQSCQAYVSGKPGDPSRPVEQLSDGTTRFGPVPTTSSPANGVTVTKGVVVLTSATPTSGPKTADPTKAPTTSPSPDPVKTDIINPTPTKIEDTTPPTTTPAPVETSLLPKPTETGTVPASTCTFDPITDPDCPTT